MQREFVLFTPDSPLGRDVTQGQVLCGETEHVHSDQEQKLPIPRNRRLRWHRYDYRPRSLVQSGTGGCSFEQQFLRTGHHTDLFSPAAFLSAKSQPSRILSEDRDTIIIPRHGLQNVSENLFTI